MKIADRQFTTISGVPVEPVYGPQHLDPNVVIGAPGEFPYTTLFRSIPPRPSMRLVTDTIAFGARHTPRFNPISISGYHIREAG